MIDIPKLISRMSEKGIASEEDLTGIHERDIKALEHFFGLSFPVTYSQFLQHFGRTAGYLSPWMSIYFDDLKNIQTQFDLLLAAQSIDTALPKNALIIGNWESIFDFIICDGSPNPAVYRIDLFDQSDKPQKMYTKSYSEYLEHMIECADTSSTPCDFFNDDEALLRLDAQL